MTAYSEKALQMKSVEQLREVLIIDLGYSLDIENFSKEQLITCITEVVKARENREERKFDFLDHLKKHVPMTEQMITDAFFTSFVSFSEKYLKSVTLDVEQKKGIWYEIRDIIISNNLKVHRPGTSAAPDPLNKKIDKKTAPVVKQSLKKESVKQSSSSTPAINAESVQSIDKKTLEKKGDRAKYVIHLLLSEGEELMKMKPRQVMDRYILEFDEAISDGYAYDKIVELKKAQ